MSKHSIKMKLITHQTNITTLSLCQAIFEYNSFSLCWLHDGSILKLAIVSHCVRHLSGNRWYYDREGFALSSLWSLIKLIDCNSRNNNFLYSKSIIKFWMVTFRYLFGLCFHLLLLTTKKQVATVVVVLLYK